MVLSDTGTNKAGDAVGSVGMRGEGHIFLKINYFILGCVVSSLLHVGVL